MPPVSDDIIKSWPIAKDQANGQRYPQFWGLGGSRMQLQRFEVLRFTAKSRAHCSLGIHLESGGEAPAGLRLRNVN